MELSERMQRIIRMVEPCHTVADIGCDHGYISAELIERGIADCVIAADVRTGPLERAREYIRQRHLEHRISCRISDGLEALATGEADTILMAGMGGPLMIHILERGKQKRSGTEILILQPQSDIPKVRQYLHTIGYEIQEEDMLCEDGKFYTVFKAKPAKDIGLKNVNSKEDEEKTGEQQTIQDLYGAKLLEQRSPVLYQYLEKEETFLRSLIRQLEQEETEKAKQRKTELSERLKHNQEAKKRYETKNDH